MLKKVGLVLFVLFVVAQFFSPEKNQGNTQDITPFLTETLPNAEVKKILETACFDCHTTNSKYPWYNTITPVNFWMAHHIEEGLEGLNFSKWDNYSVQKKDHKFEEIIEEVQGGNMPLSSYTWTHAEANLSKKQIESVITWAKKVRLGYLLAPKPE